MHRHAALTSSVDGATRSCIAITLRPGFIALAAVAAVVLLGLPTSEFLHRTHELQQHMQRHSERVHTGGWRAAALGLAATARASARRWCW